MIVRPTIREFMQECEARMRFGHKRVVDEEGVFLRQLSEAELLERAQDNLNHFRGNSDDPMRDAADVANYLRELAERLVEGRAKSSVHESTD